MKSSITIFILLFSFSIILAQPGNLDETFNEEGIVVKSINGRSVLVSDIKIQPDGKIVTIGAIHHDTFESEFIMVRYNNDGSLDSEFGNNGTVIDSIFEVQGFTILPDGKFFLVGETLLNNYEKTLIRLTSDGQFDTTFGDNGRIYDPSESSEKIDRILLSDKKIVTIGSISIPNDSLFLADPILYRYDFSGKVDSTFGTNGIVTIKGMLPTYLPVSSLIQDDGKILVIGNIDDLFGPRREIIMFRFEQDGTLDESFGDKGIVNTKFSEVKGSVDINVYNNKIIVAVDVFSSDFGIIRYNMDGSLDESFGVSGLIRKGFLANGVQVMAIQTDGKILIGSDDSSESSDFILIRLNEDGSVDEDFGQEGKVEIDLGNFSRPVAISIQNNNKIIMAGNFYDKSGLISSSALVRYLSGLEVNTKNITIDDKNLSILPNPVQNETTFTYTLNQDQEINIDLFDINGKWVQSFIQNEKRKKGSCQETLNLDPKLANGAYFLTINRQIGVKLFVNR